jgi:hypothetical protein
VKAGLILAALIPLGLSAQNAAAPGSLPMRTIHDAELPMTFSYPAELQPRDAAPPASGNSCSKTLLVAGLGQDPNQENATSPAHGGSARWATLTLTDSGCIPPQVLKKTKSLDQVLSAMAGGPTQTLGLMPMEQPLGYLLEGHRAYLAAAQGEPVSSDALQPENGAEVLAVVAVSVKDHILLWRMASNDPNLLNEMLASQVDFGTGAQALYPGRVG